MIRLFHRHRWKVVSAFCDGGGHWMNGLYVFITHVVSRCECGKLRHQAIPGRHSIEDLRGESSEVDRVLKGLEK